MNQLEQFLGGLELDGLKESEGGFTIDLEKARDKLERFRLASADHYILSVLASAVCSDSTFLACNFTSGTHRIAFAGRPFSITDLKCLTESLAVGGTGAEPRLRELGLAIQGARGLALKKLELVSGDAQEAVKFSLVGNSVMIQPLEQLPKWMVDSHNSTLLNLTIRQPFMVDELSSIFLGVKRVPEANKMLHRFARFAPIKVQLDGESINLERLGPWAVAGVLSGHSKTPTFSIDTKRRHDLEGNQTAGGYLGFDEGPGAWMIVNNGIAYQYPADISAYPTSRAVLYTQSLETDLSGAGLVQNAAFTELVEMVNGHLDHLVRQIQSVALTPALRTLLRELLPVARNRAQSG